MKQCIFHPRWWHIYLCGSRSLLFNDDDAEASCFGDGVGVATVVVIVGVGNECF